MKKTRVILYGLGEIGIACARIVLSRPDLSPAAAVDSDPGIAGRELSELLGLSRPLGITIRKKLSEVDLDLKGAVALHAAGSRLPEVAPHLLELVGRGAAVVSAAEELIFPGLDRPDLARRIDRAAKKAGVAVLGTGINPGFLMDYLPLVMAGIVEPVRSVKVLRHLDPARRRRSFQAKVGVGISRAEFNRRRRSGSIGHVGLSQSVAFIAAGLGWKLERIENELQPAIAARGCRTPFFTVGRGRVKGIKETARGIVDGREGIVMDLRMHLGARPRDEILVKGGNSLRVVIPGGVDGDKASTAALVNSVPLVARLEPGLRSMNDLLPRRRARPFVAHGFSRGIGQGSNGDRHP